jgi:lipid II:glycine glycyltransferase (peptidoglycan interpeptide bridge formation enzyme)
MENNEIMSAALIIKHSLLFGWNYFYCPRGPLINPKSPARLAMQSIAGRQIPNPKLIGSFFEEIKKMAGKEKAIFLRVDPTVCECHSESKQCHQCHPELVSGSARFRNKFGTIKKTKPIQPQNTLILDITKSEDEILSRMKQKTRYNIRLAERKGVKIKKISRPNNQEIQTFLNLSAQTSKRDKFQIHPKKYYQKMLKILSENFMAKLFFAEYQNKIIAANIVIFFSGKAIYLHGASSNIHREAMAPHLLHWEQIKEAKKLECQSYDFWGIDFSKSKIQNSKSQINSKFKTQNSKLNNWVGITRFKKGFGGEEISYPKSYDIIFKPVKYWIYRIGKKII